MRTRAPSRCSSTSSPSTREAPRASSRSSSRSWNTTCRACAASGSTSSVWAVASGHAAPASPSSRPTGGSPAGGSRSCAAACASTGEGLDDFGARIAERFAERFEAVRLRIPYEDGAKLNELYGLVAPVDERTDLPEGVLVRARLPRRELRRFARYLVAEAEAPAASRM